MLLDIEGNVLAIIEMGRVLNSIMWPPEPMMPEIKEAWVVDEEGKPVTKVRDKEGQEKALKALNRLTEALREKGY